MNVDEYSVLYRDNLLHDVIPFWLKYSGDREHGGYYTCLDRKGNVYDTDKFTWLQARQVWTFSKMYNLVEQKPEWLDFALLGAGFLEQYGRDGNGDWYFSTTREGKPLVQAYNIFSDCFACMAFGQLFLATGHAVYKDIACQTLDRILQRYHQPKGKYSKQVPGTRPLKALSLPMILSNLVIEVEQVLPEQQVAKVIEDCIHEVNSFYDPSSGLILENVYPDGSFCDSFEGRAVMPGHSLEATWFVMDLAIRQNNGALIRKARDIALNLLEFGWDKKYGGIFYIMDIKGHPPQYLEWDQKLWWVHLEAIVAMLKGFEHTGDKRCWDWFERLHEYTWKHFPDPEYGEWYGYLNRRGEVQLPLKGGKWKGCFHLPRCLFLGWKVLESIGSPRQALIY